jgi:hypothetical protein
MFASAHERQLHLETVHKDKTDEFTKLAVKTQKNKSGTTTTMRPRKSSI